MMTEQDKILQDTRRLLDKVCKENEQLKLRIAELEKVIEQNAKVIKAARDTRDFDY